MPRHTFCRAFCLTISLITLFLLTGAWLPIEGHLSSAPKSVGPHLDSAAEHATFGAYMPMGGWATHAQQKLQQEPKKQNEGNRDGPTSSPPPPPASPPASSSPSASSSPPPPPASPAPPYSSARPASSAPMKGKTAEYINSIMNPMDNVVQRPACEPQIGRRYNDLRIESGVREEIKYFFALDLFNSTKVLPRLLGSIVQIMLFLGPENCALSLVEGRSTDGTYEVLAGLRESLQHLGVTFHLDVSDLDPMAEGGDRIGSLAQLRNQALRPLTVSRHLYGSDSVVIFINDVMPCPHDILELLYQHEFQGADMTCAMDYCSLTHCFYDVWVSRQMNGDLFFEIPQSASWDFCHNLFFNDAASKEKYKAKKPLQVYSCWNGAAIFPAQPFMSNEIHFRSSEEDECFMGEPTLLCKDLWRHGRGKIQIVPSVYLGYETQGVEEIRSASGRIEKTIDVEDSSPQVEAIEWSESPPGQVKCLPNFTESSWVPPL